MEVSISSVSMDHCGSVVFFKKNYFCFFTLYEIEMVFQMEHCGLVRVDGIFTRNIGQHFCTPHWTAFLHATSSQAPNANFDPKVNLKLN